VHRWFYAQEPKREVSGEGVEEQAFGLNWPRCPGVSGSSGVALTIVSPL